MFDIGFSEVLLIFVIALVVLGPEKLPRVASQVGRWIGRARAMARQFREQLEEEVNLEEVRKAHDKTRKSADAQTAQTNTDSQSGYSSSGQLHESTPHQPYQTLQPSSETPFSTVPDPAELRADTFSHAHPTNEHGANPLTPDGGPPQMPPPEPQVPASPSSGPEATTSGTSTSPITSSLASDTPTSLPTPKSGAPGNPDAHSNNPPHTVGGEPYQPDIPPTAAPHAEGSGAAAPSGRTRPDNPGTEDHVHS
jgi:sec-independent protein translocase protein TatB